MVSIYDWFGYDVSISERYNLISKAGFDGVLLWWSNGFGRDVDGLNEYLKAPELARKAGLHIENIHAPVENQNKLWENSLEGIALQECYLKCIDDCSNFEIPSMVIHLPNNDHMCNSLGLNRINEIIEKAETKNINIAFENMRNLDNLDFILDKVQSSRIGFCYDAGHHYRHYPELDMLSKYGAKLKAIHLHDNNGKLAEHGLPFDGSLNWNIIMRNLASQNYQGHVAIEAMNWEYEHLTIDEFLAEAYKRARRLKQMMIKDET